METPQNPRRLCSEIQLFDLCDLDTCSCKEGRYCTNKEVLDRFEAIKEEDERSPEQYLTEDPDEAEGAEGSDDEDDEFGDGEYDDEEI